MTYRAHLLLWLACLCFGGLCSAFPPAPYFTLYGIVRDQVGQTVNAEGAEIILLKNGLEIERAPVLSGALLDQNYELRIRVDQFQAGTSL